MLYFDNNATTPLAKEVIESITESLTTDWPNPSSNYIEGKAANNVIENSRQSIARMINANNSQEIVFTSGGTEANNWIIRSSINHFIYQSTIHRKPHIITTNIEHDSIREVLDYFSIEDNCELSPKTSIDVSIVPVSKQSGCVNVEEVISEIRHETCLISVMMANNETGVIQPIRELGLKLAKINSERYGSKLSKILYHSDAAQAIGKIIVDAQDLNLDYLTIVGHKFYGPRIGALYRRSGSPLLPMLFGGGQETGLRPGTQNTPMIAGLGKASELVIKNIDEYNEHFNKLQSYLECQLKNQFGDLITINCSNSPLGRLPNTTSLAFIDDNLIGSKILSLTPNLRASLGAACHSSDNKDGMPSKVLISSGVSFYLAQRTIRLSTGRDTTRDDINDAINELKVAVNKLLNEEENLNNNNV